MSKKMKDIVLSIVICVMSIFGMLGMVFNLYSTTIEDVTLSLSGFQFLQLFSTINVGGQEGLEFYNIAKVLLIVEIVFAVIALILSVTSFFIRKRALRISALVIAGLCSVLFLIAGVIIVSELNKACMEIYNQTQDYTFYIGTLSFIPLIISLVLTAGYILIFKLVKETEFLYGGRYKQKAYRPFKEYSALLELKSLLDAGVLTKEEFLREKSKIIGEKKMSFSEQYKLLMTAKELFDAGALTAEEFAEEKEKLFGKTEYVGSKKFENLKMLKTLEEKQVLSKEEFQTEKSKILG